MEDPRTMTVRRLNDEFRTKGAGGRIVMTSGIVELGAASVERIWAAVRNFTGFAADDDPNEEHNFGALTFEGRDVFWKIDCYAPDRVHCSADPSDPRLTLRILTIMLAEEY